MTVACGPVVSFCTPSMRRVIPTHLPPILCPGHWPAKSTSPVPTLWLWLDSPSRKNQWELGRQESRAQGAGHWLTTSSLGNRLICRGVCQFPWYKYFYCDFYPNTGHPMGQRIDLRLPPFQATLRKELCCWMDTYHSGQSGGASPIAPALAVSSDLSPPLWPWSRQGSWLQRVLVIP